MRLSYENIYYPLQILLCCWKMSTVKIVEFASRAQIKLAVTPSIAWFFVIGLLVWRCKKVSWLYFTAKNAKIDLMTFNISS